MVKLQGAEHGLQPRDKMLRYALMELVEDVWGDGLVDVDIGQKFPERVDDWFYSHAGTPIDIFFGLLYQVVLVQGLQNTVDIV